MKTFFKSFFSTTIILFLAMQFSSIAYAATPNAFSPPTNGFGQTPFQADTSGSSGGGIHTAADVVRVIKNLIRYGIGVLILLAVCFIVAAGYYFLTAGSDPGNAEKARNMIKYTVIAIAVALLSQVIVTSVQFVLK